MTMIYVTGDIHADADRLSKKTLKFMKKDDTLIICGDFGFIWDGSKAEKKLLDKLGARDYNICFADGTHENFDLLSHYPVTGWNEGNVQNITGRLYHLMRGELYRIEGRSVFVIGGGDPDPDFFGDEDDEDRRSGPWMPTAEELLHGAENIEKNGMETDLIITHQPPAAIRDFVMPQFEGSSETTALSAYLAELSSQCDYRKWYFGSLHTDRHISAKQTAVFRKIYDVGSGREMI